MIAFLSFSVNPQHSEPHKRVVVGTAVTEFQHGAPYFAHHVKRVSGLVETALDVQVCSFISADAAAEIGDRV